MGLFGEKANFSLRSRHICSSSKPLHIYTLLFGGFRSTEDILHFSTRPVPIPCANLSHHRAQKFAITTITDVRNK